MRLFSDCMPFFRANFHTHTTESDGRATPEEAMKRYREAGYDILALTDHRKITRPDPSLIPEGLTLVPGLEIDYNHLDHQAAHILGLGITRDIMPDWKADGSVQEGIDLICSGGGIAVLAHPAWSLNRPETIASFWNISAVEIWNSVSTVPLNGNRGDSSSLLDVTAASYGWTAPLMGNDDTHRYGREFTLGWTMVQAKENTLPDVMDALRKGRFYATQGPQIHNIEAGGGTVRVTCSPAEYVIFYSARVFGRGRTVETHGGTQAEYAVHPDDRFIRVEVLDSAWRSAWASPFPVEWAE